MAEGFSLCPQRVTNKSGWQTYFFLHWTFRVPAAKEINLFLQAHVSPISLSLAPSSFPFSWPCLPFSECLCSLCPPPPPPHPLFPLSLPFSLFRRRAGSGVTNYTERAEKVVWVLPSGLPSWIIIREMAGTQRSHSLCPSATDPARFRPRSCLTGYLPPNNTPPWLHPAPTPTSWSEMKTTYSCLKFCSFLRKQYAEFEKSWDEHG